MPMNSQKRENVQTTILALLLARKRGCTLNQLVKDYYETEGDSIPWKELGYSSLLNFLHSMSKSVEIEVINNTCFVKGIASDKSKHISKLVSGQKEYKCLVGRKSHRSSHYYPNTATQRIHIPAEILTMVISLVNNYPDGVNKDYIFEKVQSCMPFVKISMSDMEEQLQNLSHKIYQSNNKIFPVQSKSRNLHSKSPIIIIGGEDTNDMLDFEEENDFQFVPSVCASQSCCIKSPTKTKPTSYFIEETVSKCQDQVSENEVTECTSQIDTDQNILCETQNYNCDNIEFNNDLEEGNYFYGKNVDILINERVKFRLEKLIQSHPDGIWCADLPEKYLQEYKVSLNYTELGFNSVREFASQLPEIFYCIQPNDTGDFMLYYAKGEVLLNTPKEKQKTTNLMELHRIYATDDEVEALPTTLSLDTCKKLIPDGIVTIGECVGHLNVTDLMNDVKPYVEVVVVEVFTPSFFWIQLRKKQKAFKTFMDDLHEFYTKRYEEYVIPLIVLEKGLNCACIYNGIWHRAIIKTVKPDLQVTVMFYDYGTLKTYPPDSVYYLDRMFSSLPAQAIPCGLVNTKPYKAFKWSRSTTHQFAIRTSQIPLIATIASINTEDNSMMITLTDTLEEEDVHINDWLVEQKLAEHGKMVCMKNRNFPFRCYLEFQERFKQKSETFKTLKTIESLDRNKAIFIENDSKTEVALLNLFTKDNFYKVHNCEVNSMLHQEKDKNLQSLEFHNSFKSDFSVKERYCSALSSEETPPEKLKSLYEKLLNIKQNSHSNGSSNREFNDTKKSYECLRSNLALNKTIERKVHKERLSSNMKYNNNNNEFGISTVALENFNHKKPNESEECDILKQFSNIPRAYANHFRIEDPDYIEDEYDITCARACTNTYYKQNEFGEIDWSVIRKKNEQREYVPKHDATERTYKSISTKRNTTPMVESCFLNMVRNSIHFAPCDENICWLPTGNIGKVQDTSTLILKDIKRRARNNKKEKTIVVSQKILDVLLEKKLSEKLLESVTNTSENVNEAGSTSSSQITNSVTADNSSYPIIDTSESNSDDCVSPFSNQYLFMKLHGPKYKLLQTLLTTQHVSNDISDLDSDDLSVSEVPVLSKKSKNDNCEKSELQEHKNDVNVNENILCNGSDLKVNVKNVSHFNERETANLDTIESSECTVNRNKSYEEMVFVKRLSKSPESTKNLVSAQNESTIESVQVVNSLLSKEITPREIVPKRESLPPSTTDNVSSVLVFNDIDLETDEEEELDINVPFSDISDLLKVNYPLNKSIEMCDQLNQGSAI